MTKMTDFILNDLPISQSIKEKIDYIKNSKADYGTHNEFRLLMQSLNHFEINERFSQDTIKQKINNFVGKLIKDLDSFIERINAQQESQVSNQNISNNDTELNFFAVIGKASALSKQDGEATQEQINNLVSDIDKVYDKSSDEEKKLLDELKDAYTLSQDEYSAKRKQRR